MAEPTVVDYQESTWTDIFTTDELTASVTWGAGDKVLVVGAISNNDGATLGVPTVSGLTFSQLAAVNVPAASNDTVVYMWSATAAASGSGQIASVTGGSAETTLRAGLGVVVWSGSDGFGTPVTLDGSTAKTISLTRVQANSHVAVILADWNQVGDVTVTATPTGTVRKATALAGQMDVFICTFGDQGATGTTSYGITNHTGTVDMSGIVVEIKGTAAAATKYIQGLMMRGVS